MEAIDVIEAFTDGLNGIEATDTGNIIKYVLRWKEKNGVEDIKKIVWYANHLASHLEKNREGSKKACSDAIPATDGNHFVCPYCGGKISRKKRQIKGSPFVTNGEPTCECCGREFIIRISEELVIEIICTD